jgi:hypothetical protein
MRDAVQFGWTRPILRVELPVEYFEDWLEYPSWRRTSTVQTKHAWADIAVRGDYSFGVRFPERGPLHPQWWLHPFDTGDPGVLEMLDHAIPADTSPAPFEHRSGWRIHPYVDFYRYWEVYHLFDAMNAAQLCGPLLNTPAANDAIENMRTYLGQMIQISNAWAERARQTYVAAAGTFEWVSLYRTLQAAALHARDKRPNKLRACIALLKRTGLSVEDLKDGIRNTLLVLWHDSHLLDHNRLPTGAERLLQQDIKRAIGFVETIDKRRIDYRDPRWYITDHQPMEWAELKTALPFEHWLSQEMFPRMASIYMRRASQLHFMHAVPVTEEQFRSAMLRQWPESYGFRRFLILFKRLHDLLNSERGAILTFREHNVVDYMILGCLVVERMITEWWRGCNPGAAKLPPFDVMLNSVASVLTRGMRRGSVEARLSALANSAKLHYLTSAGRLPLLSNSTRTGRAYVLSTLHNLRVLRNYSAHHDCLDWDLAQGREGARAMRTIVGAVALVLALP